MTRFLSREEWPLIVAGVIAGVLTSALVLYLFFTGVGGQPPIEVTTRADTLPAPENLAQVRDTTRRRGLIAQRETGITRRLEGAPLPTQPVRGPVRFVARDIVWNERNGTRFVRAESATGRLDLAGAQRGDVVVQDLVLDRPVVALRESAGGTWNYEVVLEELLEGDSDNGDPRPGTSRTPLFQVRNARIVNGQINVQRPADRFSFTAVEATLPVVSFSQPGIAEPYIRLQRASTTMIRPAAETQMQLTASSGLIQLPGDVVRFNLAAATIDRTQLADLRGVFNPADPGYGVTATGRAVAFRIEDFRYLAPERLPESGNATFGFAVRPVGPDGTEVTLNNVDARSGDSHVTGDVGFRYTTAGFALLNADLTLDPIELSLIERFSGPLPYTGALSGRVTGINGDISFDLLANLNTATVATPFTADIDGRVRLTESGLVIQNVNIGLDRAPLGALRAFAPGLPLRGSVTGRVTLSGSPRSSPMQLDVRLEMASGVALVQGTIDLTGAEPRYDLAGNLVGVDVQSLVEPNVPPVTLTARFALNGAGTDPATLSAGLRINGRFNGWQTTARDTIDLSASIGSGTARVESLVLRLATASIGASGEWRFVDPASGAVSYRLSVSSLAPFGPYFPAIGDSVATGSINASGTINGTLDRLHLAGELEGSSLRVGGWGAGALATRYDVLTGAAVPTASVQLSGRQLITPTAGAYSVATLSAELRPPSLLIDLRADRAAGGQVELYATGQIPLSGERSALVERARVDLLDRGVWVLSRQAAIRWGGEDGLTVGSLEFNNTTTNGRILLDGQLLPLADSDVRLELAAFPLGDLQRLLGRPALVEGSLSANGAVRGGERAFADIDFRVENGTIDSLPVRRLEGELTHESGVTSLRLSAALDTAGSFELDARLPSVLRLTDQPGFDMIDAGALEGSFTARRLSLVPLQSSVPRLRELRGFVDGSGRLSGTVDQPRLEGNLALTQGHVRVPELSQSYSEISGQVSLAGNRVVIENLRARSDGWLTASGNVLLEDITAPVIDADVRLDGFRPLGAPDHEGAAVTGNMTVDGPFDGLVLGGSINVGNGYIALPQVGGRLDRELVDITQPPPRPGELTAAESASLMDDLRINDLRVEVADNTWFMVQEARVQLGGTLTINKSGDDFPIVGTLSGNRGEYILVAGPLVRRFEVVAAQVRFLGTAEPNPAIDFTARRVIMDATGREVNVDVRIQGNLDRYNISLASEDLSTLPESELTSFLLFGQPSFALGGDVLPGDDLLEQTFVGGFWETLALELERSIGGGSLGLDIFQIRLGGGPFGGIGSPTLVVGRQLTSDVFLTVETGITALFEESESTLNTWAVRLDWAFDRRSRARLSIEPVHRGRSLRSVGVVLPLTPPTQQLLLELRRRWAW